MNIQYNVNPATGLMRLVFKQSIIEKLSLSQQYVFKNYLLDLLDFNTKLVLTGSTALRLLGFEEMVAVKDFDFLLLEPITEGEYRAILEVFKLTPPQLVDEKGTRTLEFSSNAKKWSLSQIQAPVSEDVPRYQFAVDIFNRTPTVGIDLFIVYWGDREIRMPHPAEIWGSRVTLGLNYRHWPKTKYKHWQKVIDLFRDENYLQETLEKLQQVEAMRVRVSSYNSLVGSNQDMLSKALQYINTHDSTALDFYDNLFNLILDPATLAPFPPVL